MLADHQLEPSFTGLFCSHEMEPVGPQRFQDDQQPLEHRLWQRPVCAVTMVGSHLARRNRVFRADRRLRGIA
jgi:hypothetical protein